ncbi:MAG: hypothetical protein Kow0092_32840 [Deferrisomatales bacterium]
MGRRIGGLLVMAALVGAPAGVWAGGTPAGTDITSQATVSYSVGPTAYTKDSNTVVTRVAELVDLTVSWQDAAEVAVTPGSTGQVLTFRLTNTGNGTDTYTLSVSGSLGGDDFDPSPVGIYFDANGNSVYDAGTDTEYVQGTNDPSLSADGSLVVFVLQDIPTEVGDGDRGDCRLTATSNTGSGAPGTQVAGAGEGGTDAVVGSSGGSVGAVGTYLVSGVVVSVTKAAAVTDPFGGTEPLPGATLRYTVVVSVTGSGTAANVVLTDPVPAHTSYVPGTLTLNGGALTDEADGDAGDVGATAADTVTVNLGDLAGGSADQTVTFDVTID